jgi:23S rRNA pseudouridine2605 synthase
MRYRKEGKSKQPKRTSLDNKFKAKNIIRKTIKNDSGEGLKEEKSERHIRTTPDINFRAKKIIKKTFKKYKDDGIKEEKSERTKRYGQDKKFGSKKIVRKNISPSNDDGLIRLNKYIANAGICSRREADELIASGVVSVNGKIVTQLGTKISADDSVQFGGETLRKEKPVYLLLNKPKDYITTTDDPDGRRTVMALIKNACRERVYPVGRLDRATSGLLLFTNDGELAKKLMHPSSGVKKIYHIELDKNFIKTDMEKIADGLELEDGIAKVDDIAYDNETGDKKSIGVELHSGKNRVVRRMFESLGYKVVKLDRVYYAGLTKKDLTRGRWRFLTQMEIGMLKMLH